jgi:predicted enzyme related to lactoylglutathione lyase
MISSVSKVVVPVADQETAKQFWTGPLGFQLRRDESYRDERWIEVSPSNTGPLLVLTRRSPNEHIPDRPDQLPHSPVFFTCADIAATYRELAERGVNFTLSPQHQHFGWWSLFTDQDGTRYALGQWT